MTLIKGHSKGTNTANIGQAWHTRNKRQGAEYASWEIIDKQLQHNTSGCKTLMFCSTSLLIHYWYSSVGNHVRAFCFILQLQLLWCQRGKHWSYEAMCVNSASYWPQFQITTIWIWHLISLGLLGFQRIQQAHITGMHLSSPPSLIH